MKKIILSVLVIVIFGGYVVFARSRDISALLNDSSSNVNKDEELNAGSTEIVPVADTTSSPTPTKTVAAVPKVKKTTCVWKPIPGEDDDDMDEDDGQYVCTTSLVDATTVKTPTPTKATTTPKPTTTATTTPTPTTTPKVTSANGWKDGTYTGDSVDAYYGFIQVKAIIAGGRLTDVVFLDYPQDRSTSVQKNVRAMPILKSEAISKQSANVNSVSGATYSSEAFNQSLASALALAKA
jgi:uncharacterized protein with FMN-binding domain